MSRSFAMNFGTSGGAKNKKSGFILIDSGEIVDATAVVLTPEAGGFYLLASKEWTVSSGNFYGERLIVISAPETEKYGSAACNHGNAYASSNAGISITWADDSTITIKRDAATHAARWALYQMF